MPPIFGMLISHKMVTLRELKEYYTYSECLYLLDIILTDAYNNRILTENQEKDNKNG